MAFKKVEFQNFF